MRINIIAIGRIKERYFADAVEEYVKRCSRFGDLKIIELPDAPSGKSAEEQKRIESAALLDRAKGYIVAMDGIGEQVTSEALAALISAKGVEGAKEISFLIGGSHGHTDELRSRADKVISFGKITLPHQLFRVVLCEQIYRALTIIAGTPYNK
ncbi:MAG: 23S rRNA (pseudouridine(1915)-N(3))-methyltransferase RlmH [Bacteroides sp.]|nr:23S rRNA (pseudouridine(1915)-N(3))-methyltransferase RlmH [Bacillota bacterium]MCM1394100.1 23S rRNA (pseudouridine(1915)-N(3))-methyltransferase RlmH [[Eubacterium] siraeum]MCM1455887.1 23S rRNA (pseudouridine(1915)-N(3))-methyltransferase RlmH [Bacteroides sp.]